MRIVLKALTFIAGALTLGQSLPSRYLLLAGLMAAASSCEAPKPRDETIRIPVLITEGIRVKEGEVSTLSLAAQLPDPEFKTDRLNEERYKPGDLTFTCVLHCPQGMAVDVTTGVIAWDVSYQDAGLHYVTFRVASDIFFSEKALSFIVLDSDRPPVAPVAAPEYFLKEGEAFDNKLVLDDPDGDYVGVFCGSGCRDFITIGEDGAINAAPGFTEDGRVVLEMIARSAPAARGAIFSGVPEDQDTNELRSLVNDEVIKKTLFVKTAFEIVFNIENVDRGPAFEQEEYSFKLLEGEALSEKLQASDPDGDLLVYSCLDGCPKGVSIDAGLGVLSYRPGYQDAGIYRFSVVAGSAADKDAKAVAAITIEVGNVNRPPRFLETLRPAVTREGDLFTTALRGSDPDAGDLLRFSCQAGCPSGLFVASSGVVIWVPTFDQSGVYDLVLAVSDGELSAQTNLKLTIQHVNRSPYFLAAPIQIEMQAQLAVKIKLNVKDDDVEDAGKLRVRCLAGCGGVKSFSESQQTLTWQTTYADVGEHRFTFEVTDSLLSRTHETTVNVIRTDRAPRFVSNVSLSGIEFEPLNFQIEALDPDGDSVTYSCLRNCPVGLTTDPLTGEVAWTPTGRQSGSYAVTFRATSTASWNNNSVKFTETVANIFIEDFNRPPFVLVDVAATGTVFEGGHRTSAFSSPTDAGYVNSFLAGDPDGDVLAYFCLENCPASLFVDAASGSVSWVPGYSEAKPGNAPYSGIVIAATDGKFMIRSSPFSVQVNDVNRPPVLTAFTATIFSVFEIAHSTALQSSPTNKPFQVTLKATDADSDQLEYGCSLNCPAGLVVNKNSGAVSWIPSYEQALANNAPYENIVFSVSDGKSLVLSAGVSVTVKNVNRAPVKIEDLPSAMSVNENGHENAAAGQETYQTATTAPLSFFLKSVDPDGDQLSFGAECQASSLPCPLGISTNTATGEVFFRPGYCGADEPLCTPAYSGSSAARSPSGNTTAYAPVAFFATDGLLKVYFNSVTVNVVNVDRPPVLVTPPDPEVTIYEGWTPIASLPLADQAAARAKILDRIPKEVLDRREQFPELEPVSKTVNMEVTDPDGDTVAATCEVKSLIMTKNSPNRFAETLSSCYYQFGSGPLDSSAYPFGTGALKSKLITLSRPRNNFGQVLPYWQVVYKSTGVIGEVGGVFDAQFFNAPYEVEYSFSSTSSNNQEKTLKLKQNLKVINTDQYVKIDRSGLDQLVEIDECPETDGLGNPLRNTYPCDYEGVNVDSGYSLKKIGAGGEPLPVMLLKIREDSNKTFPISFSSELNDYDSFNGEFSDTVGLGCRFYEDAGFTTLALTPEGAVKSCDLTNTVGLGLPNIGIRKGTIIEFVIAPSASDAKVGNTPYFIEVFTESTVDPTEFDPIQYPPLYDGLRFAVSVVNVDRPATFNVQPPAQITALEPCGSAPIGRNLSDCGTNISPVVKAEEYPEGVLRKSESNILLLSDQDQTSNAGAGAALDEDPTLTVLGCSSSNSELATEALCVADYCALRAKRGINDPGCVGSYTQCQNYGSGIGFLHQCPGFLTVNQGRLTVVSTSYSDAILNEWGVGQPFVARVATTGCPTEASGWRGGCALPGSLERRDVSGNVASVSVLVQNSPRAPHAIELVAERKKTTGSYAPLAAKNNYFNINETDALRLTATAVSDDQAPVVLCATELTKHRLGNLPPHLNGDIFLATGSYSGFNISPGNPGTFGKSPTEFQASGIIATAAGGTVSGRLELTGAPDRSFINRTQPRRTIALGVYACTVNLGDAGNIGRKNRCPVSTSRADSVAELLAYTCSEPIPVSPDPLPPAWQTMFGAVSHGTVVKPAMIAVWDEDQLPVVVSHRVNNAAFSNGQVFPISEGGSLNQALRLQDLDPHDSFSLGVFADGTGGNSRLVCSPSSALLQGQTPAAADDAYGFGLPRSSVCQSSGWGNGFSNTIYYNADHNISTKQNPSRVFSVEKLKLCYTYALGAFNDPSSARADAPDGPGAFTDSCLATSSLDGVNFKIRVDNVDRKPAVSTVTPPTLPLMVAYPSTMDTASIKDNEGYVPSAYGGVTQGFMVDEYSSIFGAGSVKFGVSGYELDREDIGPGNEGFFKLCGITDLTVIALSGKSYPISLSGIAGPAAGFSDTLNVSLDFEVIGHQSNGATNIGGKKIRVPYATVPICIQACQKENGQDSCGTGHTFNLTINDSDRRSFEPDTAKVNADGKYYIGAVRKENNDSLDSCSAHQTLADLPDVIRARHSSDATKVIQDLDIGDAQGDFFHELEFTYRSCKRTTGFCSRRIDFEKEVCNFLLGCVTLISFHDCAEEINITTSSWSVRAKTNGVFGKPVRVSMCTTSRPVKSVTGPIWDFFTFNGNFAIEYLFSQLGWNEGSGYDCSL